MIPNKHQLLADEKAGKVNIVVRYVASVGAEGFENSPSNNVKACTKEYKLNKLLFFQRDCAFIGCGTGKPRIAGHANPILVQPSFKLLGIRPFR